MQKKIQKIQLLDKNKNAKKMQKKCKKNATFGQKMKKMQKKMQLEVSPPDLPSKKFKTNQVNLKVSECGWWGNSRNWSWSIILHKPIDRHCLAGTHHRCPAVLHPLPDPRAVLPPVWMYSSTALTVGGPSRLSQTEGKTAPCWPLASTNWGALSLGAEPRSSTDFHSFVAKSKKKYYS